MHTRSAVIVWLALLSPATALAQGLQLAYLGDNFDRGWVAVVTYRQPDDALGASAPVFDDLRLRVHGAPAGPGDATAPGAAPRYELEDVRVQPLSAANGGFRVLLLMPDTDLFNGAAGDPGRPAGTGWRQALQQALESLPGRPRTVFEIGLYNRDVRWMPALNLADDGALSSALNRPEYVASRGIAVEDPFQALDNAYRTRLRPAARSGELAIFLIVVTSGRLPGSADRIEQEMARLSALLNGPDLRDVVTSIIVYDPAAEAHTSGTERDPWRFAERMHSAGGTSHVVADENAFAEGLARSLAPLSSSWLLHFQVRDHHAVAGECQFSFVAMGASGPIESNAVAYGGCLEEDASPTWTQLRWSALAVFGLALGAASVRRPRSWRLARAAASSPPAEGEASAD